MASMTQEQWASLTEKQQWDIKVALRGPDTHPSENIKWLSTAVLRWHLHKIMRVGGTLNEDLKMIYVPAGLAGPEPLGRTFNFNPGHFFQHVLEAAQACAIPVVLVDPPKYWEAMKKEHYNHYMCGRVWDALPPGKGKDELARHIAKQWGIDDPSNLIIKKEKVVYSADSFDPLG